MLEDEDELRRRETQECGSHVRMQAIRIEKEDLKRRWERLSLWWELLSLHVENKRLHQPMLNIVLPDSPKRFSGITKEGCDC